jgi:hypothetical protein
MSNSQELREKQIIKNTALWLAALLGPDMDGAQCIHALKEFARGVDNDISQSITWEAVGDVTDGVLWRCCCGPACAAAHTRVEALLRAQLNAMNQPEPGPSTIHLGDQPVQE